MTSHSIDRRERRLLDAAFAVPPTSNVCGSTNAACAGLDGAALGVGIWDVGEADAH